MSNVDEEKPIDPNEFETYAVIIRSGQMDANVVPKFMRDNPEFKRWYLARYEEPAR